MTQNSGELLATRAPPITKVPRWAFGLLRQPVHYSLQRNFVIFYLLVIMLTPLNFKRNTVIACRPFCASCSQMQQWRSCHSTPQWDTWWYHPPLQTILLPFLYTQKTPNTPGPHMIIWGVASRWKNYKNKGWHVNPDPMGYPDRSHHWRQVCRVWYGDL